MARKKRQNGTLHAWRGGGIAGEEETRRRFCKTEGLLVTEFQSSDCKKDRGIECKGTTAPGKTETRMRLGGGGLHIETHCTSGNGKVQGSDCEQGRKKFAGRHCSRG